MDMDGTDEEYQQASLLEYARRPGVQEFGTGILMEHVNILTHTQCKPIESGKDPTEIPWYEYLQQDLDFLPL